MDRPKGWHMAITINLPDEQELSITESIGATGSDYSYSDYNYGAIPALTTTDLSSLTTSSITIGNGSGTGYTIGNGTGIGMGHSNVIWTTNTSAVGGLFADPAMAVNQGGKLALKGENADLDINGKSLVRWMEAMEERMNWMQPNVELEKEWDDLKKLGDRYRKLEQKCREKAEMWKKLKSMPKPEIR
jgi:hypothetical protein